MFLPRFPKKTACSSYAQPWLVAVGGWRLVAIGGWQLATGGWWRLVVGDWRLVAVGSGWRLAVGRRWRLAVDGSWWLAVGGPLGRSLTKRKKISVPKDRPADGHPPKRGTGGRGQAHTAQVHGPDVIRLALVRPHFAPEDDHVTAVHDRGVAEPRRRGGVALAPQKVLRRGTGEREGGGGGGRAGLRLKGRGGGAIGAVPE